MNEDESTEMLKYLRALVLLELTNAQNENGSVKPELLLSRAGFSTREIAGLVGKKEGTVGVVIHRAKRSERR